MAKYRLYIDESGTSSYSQNDTIKSRYLGLLGVIIKEEDYEKEIQPKMLELKRMFSFDPDELAILHRDEIVNKNGPFSKLSNPEIEKEFNAKLENILKNSNFTLCAVVLDKNSHLNRYGGAAAHPYHYCLDVLLERYVYFLDSVDGVGDVMSEARGKVEDEALGKEYEAFYTRGTYFCKAKRIGKRLTSNSIKLRTKERGIVGIEVADLLVLTCKLYCLCEYGKIPQLTDNFGKIIMDWVSGKFRKTRGTIKGSGIKLIE